MPDRSTVKDHNSILTKRHFACRVYLSYFHYLKIKFPDIDLDSLCQDAGLPLTYMMDESNWVSVVFDQKFTARCIELTGQKDLCYRVGEQTVSPSVLGKVVHFFVKNTLSIKSIYGVLPKLTSVFSKVTQVTIVEKKSNSVHLHFRTLTETLDSLEKEALLKNLPNIIQNTIGHYAAIPTIQGMPPAKIDVTPLPGELPEFKISITFPQATSTLFRFGLTLTLASVAAFFVAQNSKNPVLTTLATLLTVALSLLTFYVARYRNAQRGLVDTIEALQELDQRYQSMQEAKETVQRLSDAHGRFVPWEFLKLLNHDSIVDVRLGDHVEMVMTTLFTDLRDFTTLVETWPPKDTFNFLNSYLARVSPIIRKYGGYVDKYLGDGIMAIFPVAAENAVKAATEMAQTIELYNRERLAKHRLPIKLGIGVNTGRCIIGTIGYNEYLEGTVVSDSVNLTSRFESLTKTLGVSIIVGEGTQLAGGLCSDLLHRPLGPIRIKGREEPIRLFEVFSAQTPEERALKKKTLPDFTRALAAFERNELVEAAELFRRVVKIDAGDKVAIYYLNIIESNDRRRTLRAA